MKIRIQLNESKFPGMFSNQKMIPRIYEANNLMVFYWAHAAMNESGQYEEQFQKAYDRMVRLDEF